MSVITYHSAEDRLVKRYFKNGCFDEEPIKDEFGNSLNPFKLKFQFLKPSESELKFNVRSRECKTKICLKTMRKKILDIINGRLIIEQTNLKNIRFVMFLFFLAVIMIYSSHSVDTKIYKLNDLSKKVVMVENEFIEKRKEIVKIKMESNIKIQLSDRGIGSSLNPPTKIVITKE